MLMKHCEMMQVYLAIGLIILGYRTDIPSCFNISCGLFLGLAFTRFLEYISEIIKIKRMK